MNTRQAALKCLVKILERGDFYDEVFAQYAKSVENPAELTNLVAGSVKLKESLDYFIEKIASKNIKRLTPLVRNILRLGVYELEYLKTAEYAVVNSYVELCKSEDKKAVSFVNAILRNFIRKRDEISPQESELGESKYLSVKYSHPEWLIKNWLTIYSREDTEKICEFNNAPPKLCIRVNTLKSTLEEVVNLFNEAGIAFKTSKYAENCLILENSRNVAKLPGFEKGFWVVQGESSSLVCETLEPKPGEEVLDFCAAPGTKTAHIAAFMENKGKITAIDVSKSRIKRITQNSERLGVEIVETIAVDARKWQTDRLFDRILVDAPCSNTGVLGARPDARWNKLAEDIENLSKIQLEILESAAKLLKPDGILVYSTCSIEPAENIQVINKFLEKHNDFKIEKFTALNEEHPGTLQILQSKHNIEGFFIAKLKLNS